MKFLLIGASMLALAGCGTLDKFFGGTEGSTAVALCDGYVSALETLATMREANLLSPTQIASVDRVRPRGNALCSGEIPDSDAVVAQIESVVIELLVIQNGGEVQ